MKLRLNVKMPDAGDAMRRISRRVQDAALEALRAVRVRGAVKTKEPGR